MRTKVIYEAVIPFGDRNQMGPKFLTLPHVKITVLAA